MDLSTLPITRDACPACGGTVRVLQAIIDELIKNKTLPKGYGSKKPAHQKGMIHTLPLLDQDNPPPLVLGTTMTGKALEVCMDYCGDCGLPYATHIDVVDIPIQVMEQVMPGPPAGRRGGLPFRAPF